MTREEALAELKDSIKGEGYQCHKEVYEMAIKALEQPEIIRCKACKWKQGAECVRFSDIRPFPDDFCSRAERRNDE